MQVRDGFGGNGRQKPRKSPKQSACVGNSLHAGLRARAVRQRALLRDNPGLGAYAVMALGSGGADRELDAAGRRHDD